MCDVQARSHVTHNALHGWACCTAAHWDGVSQQSASSTTKHHVSGLSIKLVEPAAKHVSTSATQFDGSPAIPKRLARSKYRPPLLYPGPPPLPPTTTTVITATTTTTQPLKQGPAAPTWFSLPGTASTFTPREGTAQLWMTSALVTSTRIRLLVGRTNRSSTSNRRSCPGSTSAAQQGTGNC